MSLQLDHLILAIAERDASIAFYTQVLGMTYEGERPPFSVIRVTSDLVLQLAPWGTTGGQHLAFSMPRSEFEVVFGRIRDAGIPYGDSFQSVGNLRGPGDEPGARGLGKSVYVFDPSRHLIEIRYYDAD